MTESNTTQELIRGSKYRIASINHPHDQTEPKTEDVPAFVELESGGPPPVACQVVGAGRPPSHPMKEGDRREQHLPEDGPPCPADRPPGEIAVPEQVIVSMAEIAVNSARGNDHLRQEGNSAAMPEGRVS